MNFIEEIDQTLSATTTLWWLSCAGFVIRFANIIFCGDPVLPEPTAPIEHADTILAMDAPTIIPLLEGSEGAKLILRKSAAARAHAAGIPYPRMTTTDSDLRVEYF